MRRTRRTRTINTEPLEARLVLAPLIVTVLADESDGNFSPGDLSLREAVFLSNNSVGDTITFAPSLVGKTMQLTSEITITNHVDIHGPGADQLTIRGGGGRPIFAVKEGFRLIPNVTIQALKLTGASTNLSGAAIRSMGSNVLVLSSLITGNASTTSNGGAVAVEGANGILTVQDSTISNNTATGSGGGIAVFNGGRVNVINSTIAGNRANDSGGGIAVLGGSLQVTNSTIAGNYADKNNSNDSGPDSGGGIWRSGGAVTLHNSIVVANFRRSVGGIRSDIAGVVATASFANIIGTIGNAGGLTNGVGSNIVGVANPQTVIDTTLQINGGVIPTFAIVAGSPAIDSGQNSLAVNRVGSVLLSDQRGVKRIIDGDRNGSKVVDRGAVEFGLPPVVSLSGTVNYRENALPIVFASSASVSDGDSSNFGGGKLVVRISANAEATDRLLVKTQGNAPGQIRVAGNKVHYGGVVIGMTSGGSGATALTVTLTSNATTAAVQALVRTITYSSISDAPSAAKRTISVATTDDTGLTSVPKFSFVTVTPVNDLPSIGNQGASSVVYNLVSGQPVQPLRLGTLVDPDSPNFAGGRLTVSITQGVDSRNRLTPGSSFVIAGTVLKYNNVPIGSIAGGGGNANLVVTFYSDATRTIVQQLIRSISFTIVNRTQVEANRTVRYTITDNHGEPGNPIVLLVTPKIVRG